MRRTLLSLLLVWAQTAASAQTGSEQVTQMWRDSLTVLNRLIDRQPTSTDLRLRKAAVNIELGQWDYAAEEYGRVLTLDPDNLAAHFFRAYAYSQQRHYDLARHDYERVLALAPTHFEARLCLAMTLATMERRNETLDQLNRLVEQHPDSALAWAARAGYEAERQQYDAALYDWDEALRLQPNNAAYRQARADVARRRRQR